MHLHRAIRIISLISLTYFALALPLDNPQPAECALADWRTLLQFFIVNYFTHAITVPSQPGADFPENLPWVFLSLLLPFAGLGKAVALVINHAANDRGDLKKTAARGAMIVAARLPGWMPPQGMEQLVYVKIPPLDSENGIPPETRIQIDETHIFPINERFYKIRDAQLPEGYGWVTPEQRVINSLLDSNADFAREVQVGHTQSWVAMVTSVVQLILSSISIFRAKGPQIDRYGYAAFGLSVFPYTLMSFVNFICVGVIGDYPCLYILRTPVLKEAEDVLNQRNNPQAHDESTTDHAPDDDRTYVTSESGYAPAYLRIEGEILNVRMGSDSRQFRLVEHDDVLPILVDSLTNGEKLLSEDTLSRTKLLILLSSFLLPTLIAILLPYLFIFALTKFQPQNSSFAERAWMMSWLVADQIACILVFVVTMFYPDFSWVSLNKLRKIRPDVFRYLIPLVIPLPFLFIPAIGGFVTVAKMITTFRTCQSVI